VLQRKKMHELNTFIEEFIPFPTDEKTFVCKNVWNNDSEIMYLEIEEIIKTQKLNLIDYGVVDDGVAFKFEDEHQLICFKMFFNQSDYMRT